MELERNISININDQIGESMSEAGEESVYEDPYSLNTYDDYVRSVSEEINSKLNKAQFMQREVFLAIAKRKWSLLFLTLGLLIFGTVVGLSIYFTETPAFSSTTIPTTTIEPVVKDAVLLLSTRYPRNTPMVVGIHGGQSSNFMLYIHIYETNYVS